VNLITDVEFIMEKADISSLKKKNDYNEMIPNSIKIYNFILRLRDEGIKEDKLPNEIINTYK
jgi:hypothetical protein